MSLILTDKMSLPTAIHSKISIRCKKTNEIKLQENLKEIFSLSAPKNGHMLLPLKLSTTLKPDSSCNTYGYHHLPVNSSRLGEEFKMDTSGDYTEIFES